MNLLSGLFNSSLGKKFLMALTGVALVMFVVVHMVGNLQFFLGREVLNHYAHVLKSNPEILWPSRIGLLSCVIIHITMAIWLTIENRTKRLTGYAVQDAGAASLASRTMIYSGTISGAFIVYHLLHYTVLLQSLNLTGRDVSVFRDVHGQPDVYRMMIIGFSNSAVSGFYLLGVGLLCFHLSHGIWAMLQTLGLVNETYRTTIERASVIGAGLLFIGYASIPVTILTGLVK